MTAPAEGPTPLARPRVSPRWLWLLGIVFYGAVVYLLDPSSLVAVLRDVDWRYIAAFMAIETASLWLRVLKWRVALGPGQSAAAIGLMSKAGGNLSPARVGEFAPLLIRRHRTAAVGAWILIDRILEAATTLALGFVGLLLISARGEEHLAVWLVAVLAIMGATTYGMTRVGFFEGIRGRFAAGTLLARLADAFVKASTASRALAGRMPLLVAMTLVAKGLDIAVGVLLYGAMGYTVGVGALALAQCVHGLTSVVPFTPNATGVPYAAAAAVLHELADVPADALALAVPVRFAAASVVFWASFGIGLSTYRFRHPTEAPEESAP